jgi:hypothetical protein
MFFKATDGTLFKVGPVAITSGGSPPNAAAAGPSGNVTGETWLDGRSAFANAVMKVYNGTQWVTASGFQVDSSSGNFSLSKTLTVSTLIANGTGANAYIRVPNGPSADESSITPAAGMIRFDTTTNYFRGFDGTTWTDLSSGNLTNLTVSGNAQINGTLGVDGNVTLGNDDTIDTLQVNAAATFSNGVTVGTDSSDLLTVNSATTFASPASLIQGRSLRFHPGTVSGSNYVALRAPGSIAANVTWTLPGADGSAGQFLKTEGNGILSWASSQGPIQEFTQTISTNYTIALDNNALSVGPVTVNPGVTVTVPVGARYVIT